MTKALKTRVNEVDLRPKKLQELRDALNMTENFVQVTRNLFALKDKEEEKPFTDAEIKHVEKLVKDTYVSSMTISLLRISALEFISDMD